MHFKSILSNYFIITNNWFRRKPKLDARTIQWNVEKDNRQMVSKYHSIDSLLIIMEICLLKMKRIGGNTLIKWSNLIVAVTEESNMYFPKWQQKVHHITYVAFLPTFDKTNPIKRNE